MSSRLYVVDPASTLHTLDPATGSARAVGPTNLGNVTDIAFHGPTLYAVTFSQLARLDPLTGAETVLGPIGFSTNGLAVASDGVLYAGTTGGELVTTIRLPARARSSAGSAPAWRRTATWPSTPTTFSTERWTRAAPSSSPRSTGVREPPPSSVRSA
jgi:hypothetical protein